MTDMIHPESVADALDALRFDADEAQKAGHSMADAIAYGVRKGTLEALRLKLIPHITVGSPSRAILDEDVESATRGLGLRSAATDEDLRRSFVLHGANLAFASQVITAAVKAEQDRRALLRAE